MNYGPKPERANSPPSCHPVFPMSSPLRADNSITAIASRTTTNGQNATRLRTADQLRKLLRGKREREIEREKHGISQRSPLASRQEGGRRRTLLEHCYSGLVVIKNNMLFHAFHRILSINLWKRCPAPQPYRGRRDGKS